MGSASTFTVFFDGTFWVGVLEVIDRGELRAAKVVFGAEPTAAELWEFSRTDGHRLIDEAHRAPAVPLGEREPHRAPGNPKRLARDAAKQQRDTRMTRSQEALAAAQSEHAKERAVSRRERRSLEEEKVRAIRVAKRKAKHRGRQSDGG